LPIEGAEDKCLSFYPLSIGMIDDNAIEAARAYLKENEPEGLMDYLNDALLNRGRKRHAKKQHSPSKYICFFYE